MYKEESVLPLWETELNDDRLLLRCGRGGRQNSGLSYFGLRKEAGDTTLVLRAVILPERAGSADKSSIEDGLRVGTDSLFKVDAFRKSDMLGDLAAWFSGTESRCGEGVFGPPILDNRFLS